jgi:hypothetical protein
VHAFRGAIIGSRQAQAKSSIIDEVGLAGSVIRLVGSRLAVSRPINTIFDRAFRQIVIKSALI